MIRIAGCWIDGSTHGGDAFRAALDYYAEVQARALAYHQHGRDPEASLGNTLEVGEGPTLVWGGARVLDELNIDAGSEIATDDIVAMSLGRRPRDGRKLTEGGKRLAWHDAVFSAPKSVSILYAALCTENRTDEAMGIVRVWEAAVYDALESYVAANPAARQAGTDGFLREVSGELVYLCDTHTTGRPTGMGAPAPSLHVHARIMNLVRRDDGTFSGLHARRLYEASRYMNGVAEASARVQLEGMGYRTTTTEHGSARKWNSFEIASVPESLRVAMSERQALIEEAIQEKQATLGRALTPREKQALSRATRQSKAVHTRGELIEQWAATIAAHGYAPAAAAALTPRHELDRDRVIRRLIDLAPEALLQEHGSVWRRRDAWAWLADQAVALMLTVAEVKAVTVGVEGSTAVVALDGGLERVYSTKRRVAQEEAIAVQFLTMAGTDSVAVAGRTISECIREEEGRTGHPLTEEQQTGVIAMCSSESLACQVGLAGSGKSVVLRPACAALRRSGHLPIGLSTSGAATLRLQEAAGIPSFNTADFLTRLDHGIPLLDLEGQPFMIGPKTILIWDEAAMGAVSDMAAIAKLCRDTGCSLRLCGDAEQLAPVGESGSVLRWLEHQDTVQVSHLSYNWRQAKRPDLAADTLLLRQGKARLFLERRDAAAALAIASDLESGAEQVTQSWAATLQEPRDVARSVMLCDLKVGAAALNAHARTECVRRGWVDDLAVLVFDDGRRFGAGDRIELCSPHRERVPVREEDGSVARRRNGEPRFQTQKTPNRARGWVTAVGADGLDIVTDEAGGLPSHRIHLTAEQVEVGILHSYASTVYTYQGSERTTVHEMKVLSRSVSKESAYVGATRATHTYHLTLIGDTDPEQRDAVLSGYGDAMSQSRGLGLTLDYRDEASRDALRERIREQQQNARQAWSAERPASVNQAEFLRTLGVDVPNTWLAASVAIDIHTSGIPGVGCENWLRSHGVPDADVRVRQELERAGLHLEGAMYGATPSQRATADRLVTEWAKGATSRGELVPDERIAELRARALAAEIVRKSRDEHYRGHVTQELGRNQDPPVWEAR